MKSIAMSALSALVLLSTPCAQADISVADLLAILNDARVSRFLNENHSVMIKNIESGPVAACGKNSPAIYSLQLTREGSPNLCRLSVTVGPADGNCMGQSARIAKSVVLECAY